MCWPLSTVFIQKLQKCLKVPKKLSFSHFKVALTQWVSLVRYRAAIGHWLKIVKIETLLTPFSSFAQLWRKVCPPAPSILIRKYAKVKVKELVRNSCIFEIHCCYYHHLCCHCILHFTFEQMEYIWNSLDFEAFQFFVVGILAFYIRWLVEEELRKIGAFDGRRMSEYAQCCPACQETQEIFWKIRFDIWRHCLSLRCASR